MRYWKVSTPLATRPAAHKPRLGGLWGRGFDKQIFGAGKQVFRHGQSDKEAFGLTQCSAEQAEQTLSLRAANLPWPSNGWGLSVGWMPQAQCELVHIAVA
jgi:hypothetical protein